MKAEKGAYGYIVSRKKRVILWMVCLVGIALAIYILGLILNKMSYRNIFTVAAVLFVLPIAKQMVALILLFPYHSVQQERYQKVADKLPEGVELFTDLVITSSEKVMHLDFIVVGQKQVIGLLGDGKQQLSDVRPYLTKGVQNWGSDYKVKIVDSEKIFLQELQNITQVDVDSEEEALVKSYLTSLIV